MAGSAIAVVNAGSSSIKFALFDRSLEGHSLLHGQFEGIGTHSPRLRFRTAEDAVEISDGLEAADHRGAMERLFSIVKDHSAGHEIGAVGHRIVHGGDEFHQSVALDAIALSKLERLIPLAPLHQPHNLAPIHAVAELAPALPQVGCFDTAFHGTQAAVAQAFALPKRITDRGVKRYGFHGLSYEYIASRLAEVAPSLASGRVIVAHLGNGASLCALRNGQSIASTMGFTAVDGLPMGTRCGNVDPGVLIYLMDEMKMGPREIERLIYKESGLLGVSEVSSDLREIEEADTPEARFAIELFVYRICREIGSLVAALGGLDGIVFTAGIGEHSAAIRAAVCDGLRWLGIRFDQAANDAHAAVISRSTSPVQVRVMATDEERMIATHTKNMLQLDGGSLQ